jgi:DNA ligase-1
MSKPFRIMKGDPVDPKHLRFPLMAFPKFNGFRGYVKDGVVYTASNKPFRNVHLQDVFKHLEDCDGEFVVGDPSDAQHSLERTSSVVTSKDKAIADLRFYVFDHLVDLNAPFGKRYAQARLSCDATFMSLETSRVVHAPMKTVTSLDELYDFERDVVEAGWEGLITRDPLAPYKCGRSTAREATMGKLKQFSDAEFEIVGVEERMHNGNEATVSETGRTKRSTAKAGKTGRGDLGALICKTKEGHEFGVGTGFSDHQRELYWRIKDTLRGEFAKVKFHETGTKDVPLLPVFIQIRPKEDMTA